MFGKKQTPEEIDAELKRRMLSRMKDPMRVAWGCGLFIIALIVGVAWLLRSIG
jgi:hypothetical protein